MTHQQIAFGAADLTALGIRDSAQLYQLVGRCTGRDVDAVLDLSIIEVPYDIQAITTRCRQRVSGTARADGESIPFSIFVKVVQSWSRSAAFQFVPPEQRAAAAAMLPWQVEPLAYETALARALPPGLRMPRAFDVIDLDDDSAAIWLGQPSC
jgi:hypothetical protein